MSSKPKQTAAQAELEQISIERERQLRVENARQTTKTFSDNLAFRRQLRGVFSLLSGGFKGFLGVGGPRDTGGGSGSGGGGGAGTLGGAVAAGVGGGGSAVGGGNNFPGRGPGGGRGRGGGGGRGRRRGRQQER